MNKWHRWRYDFSAGYSVDKYRHPRANIAIKARYTNGNGCKTVGAATSLRPAAHMKLASKPAQGLCFSIVNRRFINTLQLDSINLLPTGGIFPDVHCGVGRLSVVSLLDLLTPPSTSPTRVHWRADVHLLQWIIHPLSTTATVELKARPLVAILCLRVLVRWR